MKASVTTTIVEPVIVEGSALAGRSAAAERSLFSVYSELVKARLTALVLITTLVGFYAGSAGCSRR